MIRILCLLVTALLGGCMLGPDYKPPTPPPGAGAAFETSAGAASLANAPDSWWQLYDDPELDSLIQQALVENADLKTAEANLDASRAIYEGARSNLFPQTAMTAEGTYGRDPTTDEILELTGREPQSGWLFNPMLDVSYELDLFGHVRRSVEAARDTAAAVAAQRDAVRITVAAETARAYAQICTLGEQLDVAEHSYALARQQEGIIQQQRDAGASSDFDVLREQAMVAQVRSSIPPLQGEREAAVYELAALLGLTPANAPHALESCATPPRLTSLLPVGDGAALLKRRPDIREADRRLAASLAEIGVAEADLFPRITLGGFYGGASNQISLLGSNSGLAWGVGPAISWSFPNLQGPLARVSQAKAGAAAALSNFDSVVLQALKETQQALASYDAELDHHAALAAARLAARQAYSQARDRYLAGYISNLDLLTSEQTLVEADAAVAASDSALVQDQIAVFKALGGGWQMPPNETSSRSHRKPG